MEETKIRKFKNTLFYRRAVIPVRIFRILRHPSFFPEYERKSVARRLYENCKWVVRFKKHNPSYNAFGLDVKGLRNFDDYIDINHVKKDRLKRHHQDSARAKHRTENLTLRYSLLADDKYLFYSYIESFDPTLVPETVMVIQGRRCLNPFQIEGEKNSRDVLLSLPDGKYVCKASIGAFGDSVSVIDKKGDEFVVNGGIKTLDQMLEETKAEPYIIQKYIKQHETIDVINPTAVSTLRVVSTRWNENTHILASMIRFGVSGSLVDNASEGGTFVGVDIDRGCLMEYGYYYDRPREKKHPDTGVIYKDTEIPYWNETIEIIKKLHPIIFGLSTIGWDIAITPDGPIIVEINWNYSIKGLQIACGGVRKRWEELKKI